MKLYAAEKLVCYVRLVIDLFILWAILPTLHSVYALITYGSLLTVLCTAYLVGVFVVVYTLKDIEHLLHKIIKSAI